MTHHPRSFIVTTSLFALALFGGTACSSSSSSGTGGSAGTTGTGGSAGSTSTGGSAGSTSTGGSGGATSTGGTANGGAANGGAANGGAGGATNASCESSTQYPTIQGKTCADFCNGDSGPLGTGFLTECAQSADVPAGVANTYGANATACEAKCNTLTQAQICCRFGHLANVVASGNKALHCPHAAGDGTVCP